MFARDQRSKILNYNGGNLTYISAVQKLKALGLSELIEKIPYPASSTVINVGGDNLEKKKGLLSKLAPFLLGGALTGGGALLADYIKPDMLNNIFKGEVVVPSPVPPPVIEHERGEVGLEIR